MAAAVAVTAPASSPSSSPPLRDFRLPLACSPGPSLRSVQKRSSCDWQWQLPHPPSPCPGHPPRTSSRGTEGPRSCCFAAASRPLVQSRLWGKDSTPRQRRQQQQQQSEGQQREHLSQQPRLQQQQQKHVSVVLKAQPQSLPGGLQVENLSELETNIDDMAPQLLAYTAEKLLQSGALDVWTTPAVMKKGRAGVVLHVLCFPDLVNTMLTIIFYETTTLGVRVRPCERVSVQRVVESVRTPWGFVPVKAGFIQGQLVTATAEYEDCAEVARSNSIPLKVVKEAAEHAYLESELQERQRLQS